MQVWWICLVMRKCSVVLVLVLVLEGGEVRVWGAASFVLFTEFDIPVWARERKFCEATFVRKFQEILDILFKNTKIFAKDGESSSEAAKSNQITSEDATQYGRKLDVLVSSEQNAHDDIKVCSNEFKKPDATLTMKCYQQSKNLRLNACIWKKLFDISEKKNLTVDYFDFIGRRGVLSQLFFYKNNFVGHALCQVVIVNSLVELEILHESILNLYKWRRTVKKNQSFYFNRHCTSQKIHACGHI
ncbi:uncharacterized protein EV154DRAFT_325096 [Mucor mucedo]|uniref:uncharacterized protein n=1 Tax=Mucor mucedo TaxID=29922 RepID=UPI00221EBAB5|nr:uncharacterized protein EV154DRAFT_325096 [Mucor mucedo]KAI7887964.1 hypothetical protein EV154DRAFT_325096 [Mucor mucedo]